MDDNQQKNLIFIAVAAFILFALSRKGKKSTAPKTVEQQDETIIVQNPIYLPPTPTPPTDPCYGVYCSGGNVCENGQCVPVAAYVTCPDGVTKCKHNTCNCVDNGSGGYSCIETYGPGDACPKSGGRLIGGRQRTVRSKNTFINRLFL